MSQEPHVPHQDWTGGPEWVNGPDYSFVGIPIVKDPSVPDGELRARPAGSAPAPYPRTFSQEQLERERANAEAPLSLTPIQKDRIWRILSQECGHVLAFRILTRIETEA